MDDEAQAQIGREQNTVGYGPKDQQEQLIRALRAGTAYIQNLRAENFRKDAALAMVDQLEAISTCKPRAERVNSYGIEADVAWELTRHADRLEKEQIIADHRAAEDRARQNLANIPRKKR